MPGIIKNLFAAAITFGIADKEAFIKKAAGLIEEYQTDPAKAEKWAAGFVEVAEELKDNIRLQNSIQAVLDNAKLPDKKSIEQLTQAIAQLAAEVETLKAQKHNGHV